MPDGPALHYDLHGSRGPYLLLVHGMLSSRAQWSANIGALSQICRPVVVELFGHGRSPAPDDPDSYTPEAYVREFERLREALEAERWFICGQSLGAALTLRYALDHSERIIAQVFTNSNSALAGEGWAEQVRPLMEMQARRLAERGRAALETHPLNPSNSARLPADVRRTLAADYQLHDVRGIAFTGLYCVPDSPVRSRIAGNRVPALLVVGKREERFADHRRHAEENMPQLQVVSLDAGHAVNAEAAGEFNLATASFLSRWIG